MNKIGIFGDSFADPIIPMWQTDDDEIYETVQTFHNNAFKTWMDILEADTYGYGGSDLYYSLIQFEKYHHQYEQVIFVLTNSNSRLSLFHDYWDKGDDWYRSCDVGATTSATMADNLAKKLKNTTDEWDLNKRHMYSKMADWHELHLHNGFIERENTFARLILEHIKKLRPDVKIIKAFDWINPITGEKVLEPEVTALYDLVKFENTILGWDKKKRATELQYDVRPAHFTDDTHFILANLIEKWLKTTTTFFYFNLEDFKNIKPDEKKYSTKQGINKWVDYIIKNYKNDK